jgi:hypothetical protein
VFIPFLLRIFLAALMLLDCFGKFPLKSSIPTAACLARSASPPVSHHSRPRWSVDNPRLDDDATVCFAEPFKIGQLAMCSGFSSVNHPGASCGGTSKRELFVTR